jgi:hypothetical protein
MTTEFAWWNRDPETGKVQIRARIHGGAIAWERQPARFSPWEPHQPSPGDWARLIEDASRRVPRRLLSPRQFDEIKRLRARAEG